MNSPEVVSSFQITETETLSSISANLNGVVLVFVPDTRSISSKLQLKDLRNNYHKIQSEGWSVVVITSESPEMVNNSSENLSLPFPVKHDVDNQISKAFNTLGTVFENPNISERTKRRTYILNSELATIHVIDDIHPVNHTKDILRLLTQQPEWSLSSQISTDEQKISGE